MRKQAKAFALLLAIGIIFVTTCTPEVAAKPDDFSNWPAGTSPKEVGKRVAENFAARQLGVEAGKREFVIYPEVCAWYGSLTVAQLMNDKDL